MWRMVKTHLLLQGPEENITWQYWQENIYIHCVFLLWSEWQQCFWRSCCECLICVLRCRILMLLFAFSTYPSPHGHLTIAQWSHTPKEEPLWINTLDILSPICLNDYFDFCTFLWVLCSPVFVFLCSILLQCCCYCYYRLFNAFI